jgi:type II restriction enzyme
MATRDFDTWLSTMRVSIADWGFYTNFKGVYKNIKPLKVELNILNSLIGSKTIEKDFINLFNKYPQILSVIPILIATREKELYIKTIEDDYKYNFENLNYSINEYSKFMNKTGLFDLMSNHIIQNLWDYVTGVEVGMDTNGRKNRTGKLMERLVENHLIRAGLIKNQTYFKEMKKSTIEEKFGLDLSSMSNSGRTEKRFDFVIKTNNYVIACECNFYKGGGSKLNETARSYKNIAIESKNIDNFKFIWITDGILGWKKARNNLKETFDTMENLYNLKDLDNGVLNELIHL